MWFKYHNVRRRGRMLGSMQDLVIQRLHGLKLLFGLHSDGTLQVWDLSYRAKLLSHTMSIPNSEGNTYHLLFVVFTICTDI